MIKFSRFKPKKLSWKIAVIYAVLFAVVFIILNTFIFFGVKIYLTNQSEQKIKAVAGTVSDKIIGTNDEQNSIYDVELILDAQQDKSINIKIASPDGNVVNDSANFSTPDINPSSNGEFIEYDHKLFRNVTVKNPGGKVMAYLQTAQDLSEMYSFLSNFLVMIVLSGIVAVAVSLLVGFAVSKKMLNPIKKVTTLAGEIGATDLTRRIDVPSSNDELALLAVTFNRMLDRIEDSFEKQGRFISDASHELRTPLTVIQGYAQMIDRWGKNDEKVLQESIDSIKSETTNIIEMMERLLFLARGDNLAQIVHKEQFDVNSLVLEIEKETRLLNPQSTISFSCEDGLELYADRKMVKQMLRALLDNSIKYTPPDGNIRLTCVKKNENIIFTVSDTGIGIPPEDQKNVFERFYRVDKARERETGGSGLGLSIVKWIVESLNGTIELESTVDIGTVVRVSIPL
jgi:two-component system sensor histidine kinase ArlS